MPAAGHTRRVVPFLAGALLVVTLAPCAAQAPTVGKPALQRAPAHPQVNVDRVAPVKAKRLRFMILATSENNRYEP